jgi:nicotinate-nucleotide--dimethylbenzimidazole phosphoribosyltransferase
MTLPMVATGLVIQQGMQLPMPDEKARGEAVQRLGRLDLPGAGLGDLARVVGFAAGTQATATPRPWDAVRVLLLHGDHSGGAAAGTVPGESTRRADEARTGNGPLARLAAEVGAMLQVVDAPTAAPIEEGPALGSEAVEAALRYGWRLAEDAADSGVGVLVLGACGAGTGAASAAVLAAIAGAEPAAVIGRVITPGGRLDDAAWMVRCATVRDAMHRTRESPRGAREILSELGGGDIAIATGVLLGATARRIPVLLDGPVGVAACLVSRELADQTRHWCLLPDHGRRPAVRFAAEMLGLAPFFDLRLDLGEGSTALATLPLLRSALTLAASLPGHPSLEATGEPASDGWIPAPGDGDGADTTPPPDATAQPDATTQFDATTQPDATTRPDATTQFDATAQPDATTQAGTASGA